MGRSPHLLQVCAIINNKSNPLSKVTLHIAQASLRFMLSLLTWSLESPRVIVTQHLFSLI